MKRHTLSIYTAALLTMLGTVLPMSAQNKSFTVNRNDGASQKYSYSQGDRLVLSRNSQGKEYADFVEQQVYVGNDVHNIPLTSIESITFDTQATEDEGKTFVIQESGGKVELGDITFDFPSATFESNSSVRVAEQKAGSTLGEDEVSKFYKLTMPLITKKPIKITLKCDKTYDDICLVAHAPAVALSAGEEDYGNIPLSADYNNGYYTAEIPAFDSGNENESCYMTIGLARIALTSGNGARTRSIGSEVDGKVGNVAWKLQKRHSINMDDMLSNGALYDNLNKYIKEALTILQGFDLKVSGERVIPIEFDILKPGEDGRFCQSAWDNACSVVKIRKESLKSLMSGTEKDHVTIRKTLIHELMHYYQSDYDRRWAYTKYREPGAEPLIMYESGAVWAEKFMNNGEYSYLFVGEKLPTFLMSLECKLDIWRKLDNTYGWKNAWQQHGYVQSFFLEHATLLKDNKSIAKLYKDWYDKGGTTFECLKRWAPDIIKTLTFDEYFVAAGTGKVSSLVKFPNIVNGEKKRANSNGVTQMNCTVYPYGGIINEFTILGQEYLNPNGKNSLDGQIIRIKHTSKNTGIEVYTYDSVTKEWVRLGGLLTNDEEVVISGDELNKMRAVKNKVPSNLGIYVLCYSEWHEKAEDDAITITLEEKKNDIPNFTKIKIDCSYYEENGEIRWFYIPEGSGKQLPVNVTLNKDKTIATITGEGKLPWRIHDPSSDDIINVGEQYCELTIDMDIENWSNGELPVGAEIYLKGRATWIGHREWETKHSANYKTDRSVNFNFEGIFKKEKGDSNVLVLQINEYEGGRITDLTDKEYDYNSNNGVITDQTYRIKDKHPYLEISLYMEP